MYRLLVLNSLCKYRTAKHNGRTHQPHHESKRNGKHGGTTRTNRHYYPRERNTASKRHRTNRDRQTYPYRKPHTAWPDQNRLVTGHPLHRRFQNCQLHRLYGALLPAAHVKRRSRTLLAPVRKLNYNSLIVAALTCHPSATRHSRAHSGH